MTLTELSKKHNLEPESAKAFLMEWLDMQKVVAYQSTCRAFQAKELENYDLSIWKAYDKMFCELIARPTDLGE